MAEKLPTTPDGIICSHCGQDKPRFHFFVYRGKYNREFFASGIPAKSDVCWACGGDYRCIACHEVKPHTSFRIQGRICDECKASGATGSQQNVKIHAKSRVKQAASLSEGVEHENDGFMGVFDDNAESMETEA